MTPDGEQARAGRARIGLVGCVKTKANVPMPAGDLYLSTLFRGRRRYVERTCDRWYVLSAEYGLVDPLKVIAPYDVKLADRSTSERERWVRGVLDQLRLVVGDLGSVDYEIHAGAAYVEHGLRRELEHAGAHVSMPAGGLTFGEQLALYTGRDFNAGRADEATIPSSGRGRPSAGYDRIGRYLEERGTDRVSLAFEDLEDLLDRPLPPSARKYRPWWGNTDRSPQARGWLNYGWAVHYVDLTAESVSFRCQQAPVTRSSVSHRVASPDETLHVGSDQRHSRPGTGSLDTQLGALQLVDVWETGAFAVQWPDATELLDRGWTATVLAGAGHLELRHGLNMAVRHGGERAHSVTLLGDVPLVEGVGTDDHDETGLLASLIRVGGRDVRMPGEVPREYGGFRIEWHDEVITGPYARRSLAVLIHAADLRGWALHALLRRKYKDRPPGPGRLAAPAPRAASPPPPEASTSPRLQPTSTSSTAVVEALLDHGAKIAFRDAGEPPRMTPDDAANAFVCGDAFAFLVGVLCDQGIRAERAWAAPFELRRRLGHLDPHRIAADPDSVRRAFQQPPKLHRLVETVPRWIVDAARRVVDEYGGDAGSIWGDNPAASQLQQRLSAFAGIGQKKAAMAVEILERDLGVPVSLMEGSDVAFDVHVRRVFLRSGLAQRDDVQHIVEQARARHPARPGSLDLPAWDVGRRWCHPRRPRCESCPIGQACPQLTDLGRDVVGM